MKFVKVFNLKSFELYGISFIDVIHSDLRRSIENAMLNNESILL